MKGSRRWWCVTLRKAALTFVGASSAEIAEGELKEGHNYDLLVLDVMLPGEDGLSFCRRMRKVHALPIIMVTARGETSGPYSRP